MCAILNSASDSNTINADDFNGSIDQKPNIDRQDVDLILEQYWQGKLATVDYKPCLLIKSPENLNGEWVPYSQSEHFRKLLSESDLAMKRSYAMFTKYNYRIPRQEFVDILGMLFSQTKIDLFMEWVKSESWDGIDRLSTLHQAIGLSSTPRDGIDLVSSEEDDLYCRAVVHMITIGAIQRHCEPFVQDFIPIIIGDGNAGKSTTLKAIAGNGKWYSIVQGSISPEHNGREFYRLQFGKAITELKEIDSLLKKDNTGIVKAFLDGDVVEFNEKNEKGLKSVPLTSFICGTTNHDQFLVDKTGNRRFIGIYMYQQEDTPNRELLKDTDTYNYTVLPLYLPKHMDYMQQVMAQAYQLYLDGEKYDFYIDRTDIENTVLKVQNIINARSLKELEGMDLLVGMLRSLCEKNKYNSIAWTDFKTDFEIEFGSQFSKIAIQDLYKSFRENPKRFGFSEIKTVRVREPTLNDNGTAKGVVLIDRELCINCTKDRPDEV